jgi:hypothetical protein
LFSGKFLAGACLKHVQAVRVVLSLLTGLVFAGASFAASNVIQYTYDPAGNITNITRQSTGGLAITSFSPTSGAVGTAVTIYGLGFSATPANNTVTFNGVAASVTASDSGSIATTVPASATTGRIAVTVAGVTATSAQDFVVLVAGAPTVASFTPTIGASGTSVSVTGTNFNATSGATTFKLNGVAGTGNASSTTAGSFTIPSAASSGRISATTSVGTGTSTSDFIVPPKDGSDIAFDIIASMRISAGSGNAGIAVGTPGKSALVLFDGALNGWYSLHFKAFDVSPTSTAVSYKVIKPDNSVLMNGTLTMSQPTSLHLPKLTAAGTYSLLLSPGSATLSTQVRLEANPAITLDGAAIATALDYQLQTARFTFDATAGQRIGLGIKGVTFTPSGSSSRVYVFKPDGATLAFTNPSCFGPTSSNTAGNCKLAIVAPVAGTYTITVDSSSNSSYYTSASVQLSSPATGTLTPDVTQAVTLTRVGQHAAYTFTVASGDSIGVDMSNASLAPQSGQYAMTFYKPDGSYLTAASAYQPDGAYNEFGTSLPAGTYTVVAEPANGAYGTFNLTLKSGPTLSTTGSPASFSTGGISETPRAKFIATAGEGVSVGLSGLTYTGGAASYLYIYGPDGNIVNSTLSCYSGSSCKVSAGSLSAATYGVVLKPPSGVTVAGALTLSDDLTGTLTLGTPQSINASRQGQGAVYSYAATAGDGLAVELFSTTTTPAGQPLSVTVRKPDGGYYNSTNVSGNGYMNLGSHPATGTYKVYVESGSGYPWQGQLMIDAGAAMSINGATATLAFGYAGQPMRIPFLGTSGQRFEFGIAGLTYAASSSNTTQYVIYRADGGTWEGTCAPSTGGSCDFSTVSMPATGWYVLMLMPPAASTITAGTLAFSTPQAGTFVIGDPAQTIAISRPGQTARYTFTGTAAQTLRLNWSSVSVAGTGSVAVTILNPSGGTVSPTSSFANGASGGLDIGTLPSAGTYTVVLDPPSGTTMSGSFSLVTR